MIESILSQNSLSLKSPVLHWEDLIVEVGKTMVKLDYIEEKYIEAMKDAIVQYGPYVVVAPGVALLHARPEDGVKKIGLAFVTTQKGVNFNSVNDPVFIGIGISAVDKSSHIELLSELAFLIQNESFVRKLCKYRKGQETDALCMIEKLLSKMNS